MKKIKWLLIFWLFAIFWIGSSFGRPVPMIVDTYSELPVWWGFNNVIFSIFYSHPYSNQYCFYPYYFYNNVVNISNSSGALNGSYLWYNQASDWFCSASYLVHNWSSSFDVLYWTNSDFWKLIIGNSTPFNSSNGATYNLYYYFNFWSWFFNSLSTFKRYNSVSDLHSNIKLFYSQDNVYTAPQTQFNLNTNVSDYSWVYTKPINWFESYNNQYTITHNWYIYDFWNQWYKWKHFGLDSWWYSYAVNFADGYDSINWSSFSFSSLWSNALKSAIDLWLTSLSDLTENSIMNLWILVLKDNWYSYDSSDSYLLLSKNPENYSSLLYQLFNCNSYDWSDWLPNIMTDSKCSSVSYWYIADVLPFSDSWTSLTISSLTWFLGYLFQDISNSSIVWFSDISSSNVCFKTFSGSTFSNVLCFDFIPSTDFPSIKELYLENGWNIWQVWGDLVWDLYLWENPDFYTYSWLLEYSFSWSLNLWYNSGFISQSWDFIDFWEFLKVLTWNNVVPQLKNFKFWVCPFLYNWEFPSFWFSEFSFDLLVPFKCIMWWVQAWLNFNNRFPLFQFWFNWPLINSEFVWNTFWIVFIFWFMLLIFKFLKHLL